MAQQVKFYSVASLPETIEQNVLYFVNGGELYKGSTRFGCGRVTTVQTPTGMVRGDINIYDGVATVYDGTSWISLGTTTSASDILETLNSSEVGDLISLASVVTGIKQVDGVITAHAEAFPSIETGAADGQVKLNGTNATVSGWDSLTSRVSAIEGMVVASTSTVTANTVTASSGSFTNLTVTDTATFNATTVSASALTVQGSTVEQIADSRIANATLTSAISDSTGTSLATEAQIISYVSSQLAQFDNAMHYLGFAQVDEVENEGEYTVRVSNLPNDLTNDDLKAGDIVIGQYSGLEAIYNGTSWELFGNNSIYASAAALSAAVSSISANTSAIASISSAIASMSASITSDDQTGLSVTVTQSNGTITDVQAVLCWLDASGSAIDDTPAV